MSTKFHQVLHPRLQCLDLSISKISDQCLSKLPQLRHLIKVDLNSFKEPNELITSEGNFLIFFLIFDVVGVALDLMMLALYLYFFYCVSYKVCVLSLIAAERGGGGKRERRGREKKKKERERG